jgi:hypothetical protein
MLSALSTRMHEGVDDPEAKKNMMGVSGPKTNKLHL